jgi:hypothetical protein
VAKVAGLRRRICRERHKWLEVRMPTSRKEMRGSRAFTVPLFGIAVLLMAYWLLADWRQVPEIISSALAMVHWRL